MRRMINNLAALFIAMTMIAAPEALAQARRSGGSSTTSRSSSSQTTTRGSSSSRSTGSVATGRGSSGTSYTRSASAAPSRSAVVQNDRTRSTGTTTRSTGSSTQRGTGSTGSATRSTGSSSTSRGSSSATTSRSTGSSTTRSAGTVDQNTRTTRSTGSGTTTQRSTGSTTSRSSATTGSSTGSTTRSAGTVDQNTRTSRSTGSSTATTSRSTGSNARSSATTSRSSSATTDRGSSAVRSSSNVTRNGLGYNAGNDKSAASVKNTEPVRDRGGNYRYNDDFRMDEGHNLYRVPPRERDFMPWDRPGHFWDNRPHYFGYRIQVLPPHYRRITHWGIDYYFYEGIYYRPFGGVYVVCRPPYFTPLERAIDRALFNLVKFSYYCNTYRTYNTVFDNYNVIAQQNLIIAQNNARIAAQNASYALNSGRALSAYELANKLGLVQSYAYANSEYFYQDGVFYSVNASGTYTTIVPPAGALVTSLPDDYETIVLNGIEYYMVDNTVYRTILFDGQPYLEVLGQMYGSMYNQYSIYR